MPERTRRYSVGVGFRHPVTMRKASLIGLSSRCVCALRLHIGAQYLAVEKTRARVVMHKVVARAPQPVPASGRIRAMRDKSFLGWVFKWCRYVRVRSRVIPR